MLHIAMAVGLVAGLLFGLLATATDSAVLLAVAEGVAPLGTFFIDAVRMVVIPLVMTTIFVGVVRLGDPGKVGRIGGTALAFFWGCTLPAILIGMGAARLALPFAPEMAAPPGAGQASTEVPGLVDFLLGLVPANPFAAAAEGDLLQLIVFTLLVAAAATTLPQDRRLRLLRLGEDLARVFFRLVHWVLWTAPVGIFALSAGATTTSGWAVLANVAVFIAAVVAGLAVLVGLVYLPAVRLLGGIGPGRFLRAAYPGMVVGFSTTSSAATLPVLLESAPEAGVSEPVASVVVSLGAAVNRGGSALFQGAAVVFLAHLYGVPLHAAALTGTVLAVFLAALSVAPVPSASIMTLAPALEVAGVPLAGLGMLLGVDRVPDMFRSSVNMLGHLAGAVVVEGTAGGGHAEPEGPAPAEVSSSASP